LKPKLGAAILEGRSAVANSYGKLSLGCFLLAAWGGVAACDPNVVIGSKYTLVEGGTESGGAAPLGGGGAAGNAGTAGLAGDSVGGVPTTDGGAGGEPPLPGGAGAGGEPDDGILWFGGHEDGSLIEWDEGADDDSGGYYADADGTAPAYVTGHAHSGNGSAKLTIDTAKDNGAGRIARLYRRIETEEGYYSAWFNLAEDHTPSSWWSVFLFRAVKDRAKSVDLWSVNLTRTSDDKLTVSLFDHATSKTIEVADPAPIIPVGKWFELQAYLKQAHGQPSQLIVWLDGTQVFKLDDTTPTPDGQPIYWVIGNGGAKLTPAISTVYVDDARVASTFLRP
jgi:hypothetical protein